MEAEQGGGFAPHQNLESLSWYRKGDLFALFDGLLELGCSIAQVADMRRYPCEQIDRAADTLCGGMATGAARNAVHNGFYFALLVADKIEQGHDDNPGAPSQPEVRFSDYYLENQRLPVEGALLRERMINEADKYLNGAPTIKDVIDRYSTVIDPSRQYTREAVRMAALTLKQVDEIRKRKYYDNQIAEFAVEMSLWDGYAPDDPT